MAHWCTVIRGSSLLEHPLLIVAAVKRPLVQLGSLCGGRAGIVENFPTLLVGQREVSAPYRGNLPLLVAAAGGAALVYQGAVRRARTDDFHQQPAVNVLQRHDIAAQIHYNPLLIVSTVSDPLDHFGSVCCAVSIVIYEITAAVAHYVVRTVGDQIVAGGRNRQRQ